MTGASTNRRVIEQAFGSWAKRHGFKRRKLTANRVCDGLVQVVGLQKSNYSASFYIRYGVQLDDSGRFVQEPECDIRVPIDGPWGGQPAFDAESALQELEVVASLDEYVLPLIDSTRTIAGLEELRATGRLAGAFILLTARRQLGWTDASDG